VAVERLSKAHRPSSNSSNSSNNNRSGLRAPRENAANADPVPIAIGARVADVPTNRKIARSVPRHPLPSVRRQPVKAPAMPHRASAVVSVAVVVGAVVVAKAAVRKRRTTSQVVPRTAA
jgi:hypothetical protein